MDNKDNRSTEGSDEEMRELLRQMQQTTSLLAARLSASNPGLPGTSSASSSPSPAGNFLPSSASTPHHLHSLPSTSSASSSNIHYSKEDDVQVKLARLFRPYDSKWVPGGNKGRPLKRKREVPWSHDFICCSKTDTTTVPNMEHLRLLDKCSLGRKILTFPDNMGNHSHVSESLYAAYPHLHDAGGFFLARSNRKKELLKIPIPPEGYSVDYLRHHCDIKRAPIYIILLQRDLPLQQPLEHVSAVTEKCLTCNQMLMLSTLAEHVRTCKSKNIEDEEKSEAEENVSSSSSDDEDLRLAIELSFQDTGLCTADSSVSVSVHPVAADAVHQPTEALQLPQTQDQTMAANQTYRETAQSVIVLSSDDESTSLNTNMILDVDTSSNAPANTNHDGSATVKSNLEIILENIGRRLDTGPAPLSNNINVMRDCILPSAMRAFCCLCRCRQHWRRCSR
ncbi:uncharacterized protein [Paramisgurnus dabryanus]|uniref:uncharacterized protein n=1 Tax=Paramisgurnus dabryanus TaxID=90735 RepID=UPI0031F47147